MKTPLAHHVKEPRGGGALVAALRNARRQPRCPAPRLLQNRSASGITRHTRGVRLLPAQLGPTGCMSAAVHDASLPYDTLSGVHVKVHSST